MCIHICVRAYTCVLVSLHVYMHTYSNTKVYLYVNICRTILLFLMQICDFMYVCCVFPSRDRSNSRTRA